jgi:hypothetical protein
MIHFVLNGSNQTMPLTMLMSLGHNQRDRQIANAILVQNGWLFRAQPALAMFLKLL